MARACETGKHRKERIEKSDSQDAPVKILTPVPFNMMLTYKQKERWIHRQIRKKGIRSRKEEGKKNIR
jgi:hypothetical protein